MQNREELKVKIAAAKQIRDRDYKTEIDRAMAANDVNKFTEQLAVIDTTKA